MDTYIPSHISLYKIALSPLNAPQFSAVLVNCTFRSVYKSGHSLILLSCYHSCRNILTKIAECFSPEKCSALLLPQQQKYSAVQVPQ